MITCAAPYVTQALVVMAAVSFISFSLFNYVGDPVDNMVGEEATLEDRQRIREVLGLEDPFFVQYTRFLQNALQGLLVSPTEPRGR